MLDRLFRDDAGALDTVILTVTIAQASVAAVLLLIAASAALT